jgi:hypothetical protein
MIYIITVKFGHFFDSLGFLCGGFELHHFLRCCGYVVAVVAML